MPLQIPRSPISALALLGTLLTGCGTTDSAVEVWDENVASFEDELQDLQTTLAIPGLAYVVVGNGRVLRTGAFGIVQEPDSGSFTAETPLRIASVTKALSAIVALQLAEAGVLDLEAPARQYVPSLSLPEVVRVRHLLTHTSEGEVGTEYVYGTARYAMLGKVIEAVTGSPLNDEITRRVLEPAGMQAHASPALGAHAGLVSTTRDMGAFLVALDRGALLQPPQLERLATASRTEEGGPLPVSLGWFTQTVQGHRVVWSFGQDDPEHSGALLLRLPDRQLSLFILANANVLSDPFRLLMGDVSKSPFAMSFLRLFAFSKQGEPLRRPSCDDAALDARLATLETAHPYRFRDELIGWALIDLWTAQPTAAQLKMDLVRSRYPHELDAVTHFAALRLPEVRSRELAIQDGEQLLTHHPRNRWVLLAQGYLLQERGRHADASARFRSILALPNQEPDFLHRLFHVWSWMALAQMAAGDDPEQARGHLRSILASGITGGMRNEAQQMLDSLDQRKRP